MFASQLSYFGPFNNICCSSLDTHKTSEVCQLLGLLDVKIDDTKRSFILLDKFTRLSFTHWNASSNDGVKIN